jgi:hypothetical protein
MRIYKKLSVLFFSLPIISLSNHFWSRLLKIIRLSVSVSIIREALPSSSLSFTSLISPSKTEFCIQCRYCLQSLSILPTLCSPQSYTKITYIGVSFANFSTLQGIMFFILPPNFERFIHFHFQNVLNEFVTLQTHQIFIAYVFIECSVLYSFFEFFVPSLHKSFLACFFQNTII